MQITRRTFGALVSAALFAFALPAAAQQTPKEIRVGFQKTGLLVVARQQKTIERRLVERGIGINWVEFTAGPPLMEAMNAGSIDLGWVGAAPPIFAQAAGADIVYVAAAPSSGEGEAIIVKDDAPIASLADLKGKRVAVAKGTSGHNLLVAALEKAGVPFGEITPVYLSPPDAGAAFQSNSVDAWSVWDPFLAVGEARSQTRQLATTADTLPNVKSFIVANGGFAKQHPELIGTAVDGLSEAAGWAEANKDKVAAALAEATGVPLAIQEVAATRTEFALLPITEAVIASQQETADRFRALGLLPASITVRDAVWQRQQG